MGALFCYHTAMPPFYIQVVLITLGLSLLFCALLCVFSSRTVPAPPLFAESRFPTAWDTAFTAFFILLFVGLLALNLPMTEAEDKLAREAPTSGAGTLLASMLMQSALYVPMVIRYMLLPASQQQRLGFWRSTAYGALAVITVILVCATMSFLHLDKLIMDYTGSPEQQEVVQSMMNGNRAQQLILALAAVVMAPIGEEICFRGFVYNILRHRAGVWAAALATGLLFGAVHCSLVQLLPLTVFGVLQCLLYEKSKTLWLPMMVHAVFNSFNVIVILLLPYLPEALQQGM